MKEKKNVNSIILYTPEKAWCIIPMYIVLVRTMYSEKYIKTNK